MNRLLKKLCLSKQPRLKSLAIREARRALGRISFISKNFTLKEQLKVQGDLGESLLEAFLWSWCRDNGDSFVIKSLYLPIGDRVTESDLILFSSRGIIVFEVKTIKGDLSLEGKFTVTRGGKNPLSLDLFEQNMGHANAVALNFVNEFINLNKFQEVPKGLIRLGFFVFSNKAISDFREAEFKEKLPNIPLEDLGDYIDKMLILPKDTLLIRDVYNKVLDLLEKREFYKNRHISMIKDIKACKEGR